MKLKNKRFLLLMLAMLLVHNYSLWAQGSVKAYTDAPKIVIGDQLRLWIQIQPANQTDKITWPIIPDTFNGLELVEKGKIDTIITNDTFILKQRFIVTAFDSGQYFIPSFSFSISSNGQTQTLVTDSLPVQVATVTVDTAQAFKPIKEIEDVPFSIWEYFWYFVAGIVLLAIGIFAGIYFYKRNKNKTPISKLPPEKAHEKAMRLLVELKGKNYAEQLNSKAFFSELSDIVRTYLEERFNIQAMEQTTDELLSMLKKQTEAKTELRKLRPELKSILRTADLAKFAKANPLPADCDKCMQAAVLVVQQTKIQEEDKA